MKKIIIFFDRPYIEAHFCYKELIIQLLMADHKVILFCPTDANIGELSNYKNLKIKYFNKTIIGTVKLLIQLLINSIYCKAIIANPQWPLYWASKIFYTNLICLSDELYGNEILDFNFEQKNYSKEVAIKWKKREISAHNKCKLTIALGEERYQLVKELNNLNENHPYIVIPNSPSIKACKKQSTNSFYKEKFKLMSNDIVILHSGGLLWDFISQLNAIHFKSNNIKIILQTRRIYDNIKIINSNILINDIFIKYEDIVECSQSATIGLMLYNENNSEEKRNGPTAGKLGLYLAAGLPIISCNLSSLNWIEEKGIGICINNLSELEDAILLIMKDYSKYSLKSINFFNSKHAYEVNFELFHTFLGKL